MTEDQIDSQDADVAKAAVIALNEATKRALSSGQSVVMVVDDALVRVDPTGSTVLKNLPPRRKVSARVKRASK